MVTMAWSCYFPWRPCHDHAILTETALVIYDDFWIRVYKSWYSLRLQPGIFVQKLFILGNKLIENCSWSLRRNKNLICYRSMRVLFVGIFRLSISKSLRGFYFVKCWLRLKMQLFPKIRTTWNLIFFPFFKYRMSEVEE